MPTKGYDIFFTDPGAASDVTCKVCGAICTVSRNTVGPTSFAAAMGKQKVLHDVFTCPDTQQPWHVEALRLAEAVDSAPSPRVAELIRRDLADLLRAHRGEVN
jgi:hypothetical protein